MTPAPTFSNPHTLLSLLDERMRSSKSAAATHHGPSGWVTWSWAEVREQVRALSAGLVALGVAPGERVALFAATSLQWALCDLAISAARAVTVPIYASNTPDEVAYILSDAQVVALLVDDDRADARQPGRLTRARQALARAPTVRKLVAFEGPTDGDRELSLPQLLALGSAESPAAWEARARAVQPGDLCHFIYTSGTTGNPKGVMLTHGNWAYEAWACQQDAVMLPDDAVLLFLPLAHSFAQVIKAAWLGMGFRLIFARSVETVLVDLIETRPSILPSVPRVFEKVFFGVQSGAVGQPGLKGALARWAFGLFEEYAAARIAGRRYDTLGWAVAKRLVFSKVKAQVDAKLGGNLRLFISGGAPLSKTIAWFFDLLGLVVVEGYGLTETSAATTANRPEGVKIGTVGFPVRGTEVRLAADGEVLIRGPGVMKGYHGNPAATAEAIDPEGWFHSGDIGELDADGALRITDRKKDLIVTAGGKNIAPQNLEAELKTFPIVSTAMVHGDRRPYLTALICIQEEAARRSLGDAPAAQASYAALAREPRVRAAVQAAVDATNAALPPYASIKKFTLMDHDFTPESGDLTPTLKVKRKLCSQRYAAELEAMYGERVVD